MKKLTFNPQYGTRFSLLVPIDVKIERYGFWFDYYRISLDDEEKLLKLYEYLKKKETSFGRNIFFQKTFIVNKERNTVIVRMTEHEWVPRECVASYRTLYVEILSSKMEFERGVDVSI